MFRYLICYLGSLKAKQLICFRFVGGHFGFDHLVELAHTFGRDTTLIFRVYFSDMKSTFKPLSPCDGHRFTRIFLYYRMFLYWCPFIPVAVPRASIKLIVRRNIGHMAYRVEMEYKLFLSIDSSLYRPKTIFFRGVQNFLHWHFLKS